MSRLSKILLAALLAALALTGCQREAKRTAPESPLPHEDQLHQLLRERYQLLDGIAEDTKTFVETGRTTMSEYAQAKKKALRAKIDLCATQAERIAIREQILALDEQAEAWTKRRAAAGRAGEGDQKGARLRRIESEIELLREQRGLGIGEERQ